MRRHGLRDQSLLAESGREAAPQQASWLPLPGALLTTHGLRLRGKPRFKEPRVKPLKSARCPGGRPRHAGVLQLSDPKFAASEAEAAPMVLVTRTGGSHGSASVTLTTHAGTTRASRDFKQTSTTVRFANRDTSPRLVEIPLREDRQAERAETFTVELGHARCAALGGRHRAAVTIVDDDQLPPPNQPAREFTIGGTVDGLQGAGLVLDDLGTQLPVSRNGSFTFPSTRAASLTRSASGRSRMARSGVHRHERHGKGEQRERDRHRRPLPDARHAAGPRRHVRRQRPRLDARRRRTR